MRLESGVKPVNIKLPSINGPIIETDHLLGKPYMVSFFRFASCPFCNLRVNELVKRFDELGSDFTIVAIFDSSLENLKVHTEKHKSPFSILADEENKYYKAYAIEHSVLGMFKGMFMRFPTLMKGLFKGYVPLKIKGSMTTMPADFLIDKDGMIQRAYYGADEGDHLSFDEVKEFSKRK